MSPPLTLPPLVARAPEMELILSVMEGAEDGRGGVLVLRGESGVGKSRLLQEALAEAGRRGWWIAAARGYPVEAGIPHALFADALPQLIGALSPEALPGLTRGTGPELARLFPCFGGEGGAADSGDDPHEFRTRILWNLTQFLSRLSERRPLLLALDDLQWADASSLELLHFLARHLQERRIVIVAAHNTSISDNAGALAAIQQSLLKLGVARVHTVGPLSEADTGRLIHDSFGVDPVVCGRFASLLHGWTRGNPFFLVETLKNLVDAGRLEYRDGGWHGWEMERLDLPPTLREAVRARLVQLAPATREMAELLAVIGTSTSHETLHCVCETGEALLVAAVDELRAQGLLEERLDAGGVHYDFAHPVVRETVYGELGLARARLLHTHVAQALEEYHGPAAVEHAGALAYHYIRSHGGAVAAKAVRYLALAGRTALARYSDREAAEYLEAALARFPSAEEVPLALLEDLARARQRLGRFEEAATLAGQVLERSARTGDRAAMAAAERRLGLIRYRSGGIMEALEHFARAAKLAQEAREEPLAARVRLLEAECLLEVGRPSEARTCIEAALGIADRLGDAPLQARVHLAFLFLHTWTGPADRARQHGERVLELASGIGDRALLCTAHWGLTVLAGLTGDPDAAAHHVRASAALAEEIGSPLHRLRAAELEIELLTSSGDWDVALALGERTIAGARALNQRMLLPRVLVSTAMIHFGRGDLDRGRLLVEEAWELSGAGSGRFPVDVHTVVPAYEGRAAQHLWAGEYQEAVRVGTAGLSVADRTGYRAWSLHRLLPLVVEAQLSMGDVENASRIGERLARDSARLGHRLGLAWAEVCEAVLVWLRGDIRRGTERLRAAAERLEAISAVPDAARLRRHFAARLRDQGEREQALRELRHVHEVFLRLGARRELAKTREQIRELGARPPVRERGAGAEGLSSRELEIARMVAERKSNKAIGRELDISTRTVGTHLSNIFRKLGISSRVELSDFVRSLPGSSTLAAPPMRTSAEPVTNGAAGPELSATLRPGGHSPLRIAAHPTAGAGSSKPPPPLPSG
jgi:DNA-binding CsgD family transcriptional regulator/tetratricopeptide (TPR) repeat protein